MTKCLVEFRNCLIFPNPSFLINDHAKIQSLEKLQGCCTFEDYADAFVACFQTFWTHYNTSYVTCDRYLGQQLIKLSTCTKRTAKRISIRKLIQGPEVELPRGQQGRSCNIRVSRTLQQKLNHWLVTVKLFLEVAFWIQ